MKHSIYSLLLGVLMLVGSSVQGHADFNILLKLGDIQGESVEANHKGWIDVRSFNHGISNAVAVGGSGTGASKAAHADFRIEKRLDKSSLPSNLKANMGSRLDTAVVELQTTGANPQVFYRVTMSGVAITGTSISGSASDLRPLDSLSLTYKKIVWEYWPIDSNGKLGPVIRTEWDVTTNTGG